MGPWRVNFLPLQRLSEKQKGSHVGQCKRCFQAYAANAEHRTGHYWESGVILENRNCKQQEKKLIDEIDNDLEANWSNKLKWKHFSNPTLGLCC